MLGFDRERLERAGTAGDLVVPRRDDHMLERRRLAAVPPRGSRASARSSRAAATSRAVIAAFAPESTSRCATAGAAKPEKTGTWTAPMCAQACEAIAASGDIGR